MPENDKNRPTRNIYFGFELADLVDEAAEQQGKSVSAFISDCAREKLDELGFEIPEKPVR